MEKEGLRLIYRDKRSKLSNEQQLLFHQQLTNHFFSDPQIVSCLVKPGAIVHTYLPISRQHEVDTWPLIDQLWRGFPTVHTWSSVSFR